MEYDGHYMMKNNYEYSKALLHLALENKVPFIYASSAAVYGSSTVFKEDPEFECPLNIYGYSKLLFDRYVQRLQSKIESTVVGLRYFMCMADDRSSIRDAWRQWSINSTTN